MHRIELPDWAIERGRRMNFFPCIDPARTALLAVDMQNAFVGVDGVFGNAYARDIVPNVNRLAACLRHAGGLVVWTRQSVSSDARFAAPGWHWDKSDPFVRRAMAALTDGADGHKLHAALEVHHADAVLNKYRYSAFIQPDCGINAALRAKKIETLIMAGTLTNVCCESSARDAYMLGYKILFAADATAATTDAEHNAALLNLCLNFADVRMTDAILALIEAA